MKRSEIEAKLSNIKSELNRRILSAPMQYFIIGIILGVFLCALRSILLSIIMLLIIVTAAIWYFAEPDEIK